MNPQQSQANAAAARASAASNRARAASQPPGSAGAMLATMRANAATGQAAMWEAQAQFDAARRSSRDYAPATGREAHRPSRCQGRA